MKPGNWTVSKLLNSGYWTATKDQIHVLKCIPVISANISKQHLIIFSDFNYAALDAMKCMYKRQWPWTIFFSFLFTIHLAKNKKCGTGYITLQ